MYVKVHTIHVYSLYGIVIHTYSGTYMYNTVICVVYKVCMGTCRVGNNLVP